MKSGFTLAEVLITLVIIGVIAAMTIPTVMNRVNGERYKVAANKMVSSFSQACLMKRAKGETSCYDGIFGEGAVPQTYLRTLFNTVGSGVYVVDGSVFGGSTTQSYDYEQLQDGSFLVEGIGGIFVDVNGLKAPNKITKDKSDPQDIYPLLPTRYVWFLTNVNSIDIVAEMKAHPELCDSWAILYRNDVH